MEREERRPGKEGGCHPKREDGCHPKREEGCTLFTSKGPVCMCVFGLGVTPGSNLALGPCAIDEDRVEYKDQFKMDTQDRCIESGSNEV